MRYLAIDLGDKRTGLAVGDDELKIAHPLCVLEIPIGDRLVQEIVQAVSEHEVDELVMGLPLNMDGSRGSRAILTTDFGERVKIATRIAMHYQDERLTSASAEEHLDGSGKTHKQKRNVRDALAAAEILKDFLHADPRAR